MNRDATPEILRPGRLAKLAGVSTDTLRHYERCGLLDSRRSSNGYREYPSEALSRVRLIRRALSIGFSLDELTRLTRIRSSGGVPCRQVRALAAAKLESVEAQIRDLNKLRRQIRDWLELCDARLTQTPRGQRAWLLESLPVEALGGRSPGAARRVLKTTRKPGRGSK